MRADFSCALTQTRVRAKSSPYRAVYSASVEVRRKPLRFFLLNACQRLYPAALDKIQLYAVRRGEIAPEADHVLDAAFRRKDADSAV